MGRFLLEHSRAAFLSLGVLAILGAQLSPRLATASEALAYACLVGVFAASPAVRRKIASYPKPHRAIGLVLLSAMLVGQVLEEDRALFPFASWHMYSRTIPDDDRGVRRVRLNGTTRDGQREALDLDLLFGRVAWRVSNPLRTYTRAIQRKRNPESRAKAEARLSSWTRAIARTWNDTYSDRKLSSIDIEQKRIPLEPGFAANESPWELIYRVEAIQ